MVKISNQIFECSFWFLKKILHLRIILLIFEKSIQHNAEKNQFHNGPVLKNLFSKSKLIFKLI
jgi:hypothetical protein